MKGYKTDILAPTKTPADILRQVNSAPRPVIILSPTLGPRRGLAAMAKELEKAGYVAIIAEPGQVKIMETITVAPVAAITRAALRAIREDTGYIVRGKFANAICDALAPAAAE